MLETPSKPTLQLEGIDQQDFTKNQLVQGCYPYQIGLQQRIPGKTLQEVHSSPIGSIYVFYGVLGRQYILTDYGQIQIQEVDIPPITPPSLPPTSDYWIDTFSGYDEGLVSRLWGAGLWDVGVGVCETLVSTFIDPFSVYATIPDGSTASSLGTPPTSSLPIALPPPTTSPAIPVAPTDSSDFLYPPGTTDLILHKTLALADNSCTGQGTQPVPAIDSLHYFDVEGGTEIDAISASSLTVGAVALFHGKKIGRNGDTDVGLVVGTCPGPPAPVSKVYTLLASTNHITLNP